MGYGVRQTPNTWLNVVLSLSRKIFWLHYVRVMLTRGDKRSDRLLVTNCTFTILCLTSHAELHNIPRSVVCRRNSVAVAIHTHTHTNWFSIWMIRMMMRIAYGFDVVIPKSPYHVSRALRKCACSVVFSHGETENVNHQILSILILFLDSVIVLRNPQQYSW